MSGVELKEHSIDMKWGPRLMGGNDQRYGFDICCVWGLYLRGRYGNENI